MDNITDLITNSVSSFINFFTNAADTVVKGATEVITFIKNAFDTLRELVFIFPLPIRSIMLSALLVGSAYLLYKIARGG